MAKGTQQATLERMRAEKEARRLAKLKEKFPTGVAEVVAKWDPKKPFMDPPYPIWATRKPRATSLPVRVQHKTGIVNEGKEEASVKVLDFKIWPNSGRTDQAGTIHNYLDSFELLAYLADPQKGWGSIYRLVPVTAEQLQIEDRSLKNPESRAEYEKLRRAGNLMANPTGEDDKTSAVRRAPASRKIAALSEDDADDLLEAVAEEDPNADYDGDGDVEYEETDEAEELAIRDLE